MVKFNTECLEIKTNKKIMIIINCNIYSQGKILLNRIK